MTKYGIVHNNYFVMHNARMKNGREIKRVLKTKVWSHYGHGNGYEVPCIAFDTYEEAENLAKELFWNDKSFYIAELDENNFPIVTEELEALGYYNRPEISASFKS